MAKNSVITLHREGFFFGANMLIRRNKIFVRRPIISSHFIDRFIFYQIPEFFAGFGSAGTQYAIDEFFPISINSNPYPAIVFF